jgi:hypothetical protein
MMIFCSWNQGFRIVLHPMYQNGGGDIPNYHKLSNCHGICISNGHKIYRMAIWPLFSVSRTSQIYQNWDFWLENICTIWQSWFERVSEGWYTYFVRSML